MFNIFFVGFAESTFVATCWLLSIITVTFIFPCRFYYLSQFFSEISMYFLIDLSLMKVCAAHFYIFTAYFLLVVFFIVFQIWLLIKSLATLNMLSVSD